MYEVIVATHFVVHIRNVIRSHTALVACVEVMALRDQPLHTLQVTVASRSKQRRYVRAG